LFDLRPLRSLRLSFSVLLPLLLPCASLASAGPDDWRAEVWAEVPGTFDTTHSALTPAGGGVIYVDKLRNDLNVPLALLPFLQHPSSVGASFGRLINGYQGSASGAAYPWASAGFDFSTQYSSLDSGNSVVGGAVDVSDYLRRNLRLALGYWGTRDYQTTQYVSYDGGRAIAQWLTHAVLLSFRGELGSAQQQSQQSGVPLGINYMNLYRSAEVSSALFIGRQWSVSLFARATGQELGNASRPGYLRTERLGASGQVYVTDSLYALVGYRADFRQSVLPLGWSYLPTAPFTSTAPLTHTLYAEFAARF